MHSTRSLLLDEPSPPSTAFRRPQSPSPQPSQPPQPPPPLTTTTKRRQTLPVYYKQHKDEQQHAVGKYDERFPFLRNSKFLRELESDSVDSELIEEELSALQEVGISTRERIVKFLQSNPVQILLCVIVLLDAGIVISQILLDLNSVKEKLHRRDFQLSSLLKFIKETETETAEGYTAQNVTLILRMMHHPAEKEEKEKEKEKEKEDEENVPNMTAVAAAAGSSSFDPAPRPPRPPPPRPSADGLRVVIDEDEGQKKDFLHEVAHGLHFASIALLGFLVVEDFIKILAMGRSFFRHKIEIFDAVIIVSSFAIDIFFLGGVSGEEGQKAAAVLVILLLWRIARVVDGILVTVKQRQEFRIRLQKRARRMAEKKLEAFEEERNAKTKQIEALKELCAKAGIADDDIDACAPSDSRGETAALCALSSVARLSVSMTMLMSSGVYRPPPLLDDNFTFPKKIINGRRRTKGQTTAAAAAAEGAVGGGGGGQQRRRRRFPALPRIESLPIIRLNSRHVTTSASKEKQQQRHRKSLPGKIRDKSGNGRVTIEANEEDSSHVTIESMTSSVVSGPEVVESRKSGREIQTLESPVNNSGIEIVINRMSSDDETEETRSTGRRQQRPTGSGSQHASASSSNAADQLL